MEFIKKFISIVFLALLSESSTVELRTSPPEENHVGPSIEDTPQVVHRSFIFPQYNSDIVDILGRDEGRLRRIHVTISERTARRHLISAPVSSGLSLGSGEYFVRLGVGTPTRGYYLELDTGSDMSWLQCSPCTSCYSQYDPIYNPGNSTSYSQVYCGSSVCQSLDYSGCRGVQCYYRIVYGDRSASDGDLSMESFTVGSTVLRNVVFGCGHSNSGLFRGEAGLLGMGGGYMSFVTQGASTFNTVFSYCLVSRYNGLNTSSPLSFGVNSIPFSGRFTPLLVNPLVKTFYYGMMTGISVGGSLLPIPQYLFQLSLNGTGGVIFDTGTSVTRLVPQAYTVVRDAYRAGARNLPRAPAVYLLDTCYDLQGLPTVQIPSLAMHFQNGVDLNLPGSNILIPVDRNGTFCLAFAPSSVGISVVGNIQQQSFRIAFDLQRNLIAVAPRQC